MAKICRHTENKNKENTGAENLFCSPKAKYKHITFKTPTELILLTDIALNSHPFDYI